MIVAIEAMNTLITNMKAASMIVLNRKDAADPSSR